MGRFRAVLFDYGNVLCAPQLESDLEAMAECCQIDLNRFKTYYWQLRDEYDLGVLDGRGYWTKIAAKGTSVLSDDNLARLIELDNKGWTRPNPVMSRWAAELRQHGIVTAIVSNMPIDIRRYLDHGCEWLPKFDQYTFSCDIKAVKPDAEIYLHCLKEIGVQPAEALFLDDRKMNVDAALSLGLTSLVFSTAEALQNEIAHMDLPPISILLT